MLNYAAAQLNNSDRVRDIILSTDTKDVITVRTKKKINCKMRQWEISVMPGTDTIVIVSYLVEKVYRGLFHKGIRLENVDSVAFGYIKKCRSLYLRHKRMQFLQM
jgi:hypothetical protein